jgi:phosphatidate cytidylyltransferase
LIVTGVDPAKPSGAPLLVERNNLMVRIASSLVLAVLAIGAAYLGGLVFIVFWMIAAFCVLWEWDTLISPNEKNQVLTIGLAAIGGAALLLALGRTLSPIALVLLGMLAAATLAPKAHRGWCVGGLLYAGSLLIASVLLRRDAVLGFPALIFLFLVVWLTDIVAYFTGRALGGPKLMPDVSPNKTWSGAIGGTVGGIVGGTAVAAYFGIGSLVIIGILAFVLSIAAQGGDLLESAIKRRFNVKDAGRLIPGHGGVMDRVDGFLIAAIVAAAIGVVRGGLDSPAQGLLSW